VGAAAKFGGELAHPHHADLVAVLLAEEGHGAGLDGVLMLHEPGLNPVVAADFGVYQSSMR
jgi:hypothetical protein